MYQYNREETQDKKRNTHNTLVCNAGTLRRSKVNIVTNPKDPAANHSGRAAFRNHAERNL